MFKAKLKKNRKIALAVLITCFYGCKKYLCFCLGRGYSQCFWASTHLTPQICASCMKLYFILPKAEVIWGATQYDYLKYSIYFRKTYIINSSYKREKAMYNIKRQFDHPDCLYTRMSYNGLLLFVLLDCSWFCFSIILWWVSCDRHIHLGTLILE